MTRSHVRPAQLTAILCLLLALPGNAKQPDTVTIDPAAQYQTFDGWGVSLCWWANVVGAWRQDRLTHVADLLFDPDKGLGLDIVRYNIGGGDAPDHHHMRPGAAIQGFQPKPEAACDWTADASQRRMLNAAIERGVRQVDAFANSPPWWMTVSGCTAGAAKGGDNNLRGDRYDDFATYLAAVTRHFRDEWGVTFATVEPVNEPEGNYWRAEKRQEGCHFDVAGQERLIRLLHAKLQQQGLPSRIAAMDALSIDAAARQFSQYAPATRAAVSRINTHTYHGTKRAELRELANRYGKQLYMSEVDLGSHDLNKGGVQHDHDSMVPALDLAAAITRDLRDMRAEAWIFWQAIENEQFCIWWKYNYGLLHGDLMHGTEELWITRKYYAMGQYAKFITPGMQMIGTDADDTVAFTDRAAGAVTVVSYNRVAAPRTRRYDLTAFTELGKTVSSWRTSADGTLAPLRPSPCKAGSFVVEEPGCSISTYVLGGARYHGVRRLNDAAVGDGPMHFRFHGDWQFKGGEPAAFTRDNHWSWTKDDWYEVRFDGVQARLYVSVAPVNGIAAVSVDGGPEKLLDFYAPARRDQALVFTTPKLATGEHVLRVRVTGRKNPKAEHPVIPADRIDVIPIE